MASLLINTNSKEEQTNALCWLATSMHLLQGQARSAEEDDVAPEESLTTT